MVGTAIKSFTKLAIIKAPELGNASGGKVKVLNISVFPIWANKRYSLLLLVKFLQWLKAGFRLAGKLLYEILKKVIW